MPINSSINLNIGQVPKDITDPVLYEHLLDIHNALELLAQGGAEPGFDFNTWINKYLNVTLVVANYAIPIDAGMVLVAATVSDILISLPSVEESNGFEFTIKCIEAIYPYKVELIGSSGTPIDDETLGIRIDKYDSIVVKSDGSKWWII